MNNIYIFSFLGVHVNNVQNLMLSHILLNSKNFHLETMKFFDKFSIDFEHGVNNDTYYNNNTYYRTP